MGMKFNFVLVACFLCIIVTISRYIDAYVVVVLFCPYDHVVWTLNVIFQFSLWTTDRLTKRSIVWLHIGHR